MTNPIAGTLSALIAVSTYTYPKEPKLLGERLVSGLEQKNVQDDPQISCHTRNTRKLSKATEITSKGVRSQLEGNDTLENSWIGHNLLK